MIILKVMMFCHAYGKYYLVLDLIQIIVKKDGIKKIILYI